MLDGRCLAALPEGRGGVDVGAMVRGRELGGDVTQKGGGAG